MESLSTRLRRLRVDAGLTQQRLAELAGVSVMTVSHTERGREPSSATVAAFARVLGVPASTLHYGDQQVSP
jgi:transcriptional regulator with XRE-family HTH domain